MGRFEAALQTLELDQKASCEEIKQAYKDLVIVWHPDRFSHNPRLQQKAQEKLKQFNQAYEHLRDWQQAHSASEPPPRTTPFGRRPATSSSDRRSPPWPNASRRPPSEVGHQSARSPHSCTTASTAWISLADAEFILKHYHFEALNKADHAQCQYQGGPFVLMVCDTPPEVMISVPCDSLQTFDRILLSIPCKSMGHFIQQEAQQLLQLLYAQDLSGS